MARSGEDSKPVSDLTLAELRRQAAHCRDYLYRLNHGLTGLAPKIQRLAVKHASRRLKEVEARLRDEFGEPEPAD